MKVKSKTGKIIHYYAQSSECDWTAGISCNADLNKIKNRIRNHVRQTGHKVIAEKGSSIEYYLE
jgi:hypothetical protein